MKAFRPRHRPRLAVALWGALLLPTLVIAQGTVGALRFALVQSSVGGNTYLADGTVEALRDTLVAAQVAGRITEVSVRAGDHVLAGHVLMRIDPSAAAQQVAGSQAQLAQAQALLASARADQDRTQQLFDKGYLSKAALDHAQAQFKAAQAQAQSLNAQARATAVQAAYYTVRAPYAGWVARVAVSVGDMASPGAPLLGLYDPSALRVTAQVPESVTARLDASAVATVSLPHAPQEARQISGTKVTVLPALDATTHSATVRIDLPSLPPSVQPGQFAQTRLSLNGLAVGADEPTRTRTLMPWSAVVQRGEVTAAYVINAQGQAQLRQIRLGRRDTSGNAQVEVLAGLSVGEKVALDPVAAAQTIGPAAKP